MSLTGIQWEAAGNILIETVDNLELTLEEALIILQGELARRQIETIEADWRRYDDTT